MTTVPGCATFTVTDPCNETTGFGAAVAAAQASDVTVVVVGEPAGDSGEASSRTMLGLPGQQLALVQQIAATNKPYVVVLMNGRALTIPWLANNAPALLESWYPGTEGGDAVADALFGKVDPSGKLPMSFPVNVGQIPVSYDELPTGRPYSRPTSTPRSTSTRPTRRSTRLATGSRTPRSRSRTCMRRAACPRTGRSTSPPTSRTPDRWPARTWCSSTCTRAIRASSSQ